MLKIHYHPMSFPALGTIFTAEAAGADYELNLINLAKGAQKQPEYLEINPYGRVPALQDGDFKLAESASIMRYIARNNKTELAGGNDLQTQATVDQWMDYVMNHVRMNVALVQFNRSVAPLLGVAVNESSIETGLKMLERNLPIVEQRLSESPYLCGDELTIADIALVASLEPIKMARIDISQFENLTNWLETQRQQTYYTNVHSHFGAELGM